ncbi:MAG: acyl-CoA thioesterase [Mycobacterium sp.]|nr:acyl-CoA thioesterase [Mycobacterium sp.]
MSDELDGDETSLPGEINAEPLSQRLRLVDDGDDTYSGLPPSGFGQRVYGGHLLGQSALAAAATVDGPDRVPVSLHCYFLMSGRPDEPLRYTVSRSRDGRSFSARQVVVTQGAQTLLTFQALFNEGPPLPAEVRAAAAPAVPPPETLAPLHQRRRDGGAPDGLKYPPRARWWTGSRPFDIRFIGDDRDGRRFWFRTPPENVADRTVRRAVLACASDRSVAATILAVRGEIDRISSYRTASLDHAVWFHRDAEIGEWLLYQQDSPFSARGTGLIRGSIFNEAGELVATVVQQGLFT